jgi:hypothetical protein
MSSIRRTVLGAMVVGLIAAAAPVAVADPPGPGDKQCIPGINGNPHPGAKGGTCPGRK